MQRYQNSLHFKFFLISVEGGGHRKSIFSQIQNSPNHPRGGGGGGQENYGIFPQFVTFHIWMAPHTNFVYDSFIQKIIFINMHFRFFKIKSL